MGRRRKRVGVGVGVRGGGGRRWMHDNEHPANSQQISQRGRGGQTRLMAEVKKGQRGPVFSSRSKPALCHWFSWWPEHSSAPQTPAPWSAQSAPPQCQQGTPLFHQELQVMTHLWQSKRGMCLEKQLKTESPPHPHPHPKKCHILSWSWGKANCRQKVCKRQGTPRLTVNILLNIHRSEVAY